MHPECCNLVFLFFELYYITAFIYYTLLFGSGFFHQALAHFHGYGVYSLVYYDLLISLLLIDTGILCIPKVHIMPLHLRKRPMLVPAFANQKTSEEYFHFYKKRQEGKITSGVCLAASHYRGSIYALRVAVPPTRPHPGLHWASRHLSITPP